MITQVLTLVIVKGVNYMISHNLSDRLVGCQEQPLLERYICIQFEYVCKPVFCEHNLPVEATLYSSDKTGKKGTYDLLYKNPYFFVTTWPNQMGSSLNCRKIVIVSIRFDFSSSIKGSFAIDTQMPILPSQFCCLYISIYRVAPKNGTVDFCCCCSDQQLPCWIEHLFLIIITPRSSNLVENFLFYE